MTIPTDPTRDPRSRIEGSKAYIKFRLRGGDAELAQRAVNETIAEKREKLERTVESISQGLQNYGNEATESLKTLCNDFKAISSLEAAEEQLRHSIAKIESFQKLGEQQRKLLESASIELQQKKESYAQLTAKLRDATKKFEASKGQEYAYQGYIKSAGNIAAQMMQEPKK